MVSLAVLLAKCGSAGANPGDELISFVNDIDETTGAITTVKVLL